MAKTTRQFVFEGMEHMQDGLHNFVLQSVKSGLGTNWPQRILGEFPTWQTDPDGKIHLDTQKLLQIMIKFWHEAFRSTLDQTHRALVSELVEVRNKLAHERTFSYDDAERALDSMRRLLDAVSAGQSVAEITRMREQILRTKFTELARNEERKTHQTTVSTETATGLKPWREVVEPHQDVATGNFQSAEFAADLSKVYEGEAQREYQDPQEFYARTYLTDGLSELLKGAAKRLSGTGGDPVVELQTNFGGGKTHSMLALFHLASDVPTSQLSGLDQLLTPNGLTIPDNVSRAVLVGTSRGPRDVIKLDGGQEIKTTWGEMAWQLGGQAAFDMVAENDASGIAPGSTLLQALFDSCAPCLILIDEWVAYLRQIYKVDSLPSGSFDANLSFVQSLTEAVKTSKQTLLVASLPASQIEVGGDGGQEALTRLKQTFSRVESSWRPASQEESYEIVRRRLFQQIPGDKFMHRDNVTKQFMKLYRENQDAFPSGCSEEDYKRKLEKAYPIHPELFDQLYTTWGSLEKFQRTRGVLRLMAQVIHDLWLSSDPSVMIMPGNIGVSAGRVEPELTRYLEANWQSVIAGDVDGASATPLQIDQSAPNLARFSATRRVARTIFMGTAPLHGQENKGIDQRVINLGVIQPGEKINVFADAVRRLSGKAKFMHSDMGRYWYSMDASLNRTASDRAAQFEEALVQVEVNKALKSHVDGLADRGYFDAVQACPTSSSEVPDEPGGVRAVVLGIKTSHNGREGSEALTEAKDIVMNRGSSPRVNRNTLVFIAPDARQVENLLEAMRASLAWKEISRDADSGRLDLRTSDIAMTKDKIREAEDTMLTRLKEAWCYMIYPGQSSAQDDVEYTTAKFPAQDGMLARASKKLHGDGALMREIGPQNLVGDLDNYLWRDQDHLLLKDLWSYLNRYLYLPRLVGRETLTLCVQQAVASMVPGAFAYAERYNEQADLYEGLVIDGAASAAIMIDDHSVLVKKEVAEAKRLAVVAEKPVEWDATDSTPSASDGTVSEGGAPTATAPSKKLTRFVGRVKLSADRPARDMGQIVEGIIEQLTTLPGSTVELSLEIDAEVPSGLDQAKVRTLNENANTLKFSEKSIE